MSTIEHSAACFPEGTCHEHVDRILDSIDSPNAPFEPNGCWGLTGMCERLHLQAANAFDFGSHANSSKVTHAE